MRDRVAIVTGASRGIGAATAVALARAGCHVACAARATSDRPFRLPGTVDETAERCRAAGVDALPLPTDLTDDQQVEAMVTRTLDHFGRLDIVVNNAAVTFPGDLDLPTKRFDLIMAVNLRAPFVATRTASPALRKSDAGRVVNISSVASLVPIPDASVYGMSKIALEHFTLDAARQLHPDVAVNCFRIDVPVASEGYLSNASENEAETFEPVEVAAEGILWMLTQPADYTARVESMWALRRREGLMPSRSRRPIGRTPPLEPFVGLYDGPDYTRFFD
jgi:NAD(P)-dependent dehydrogenase (short-subunit alcohol dehydrogenase family)